MGRMEKADLVRLVAQRLQQDPPMVAELLDACLEELIAALGRGERVSLRDFGTCSVRPEASAWVFKFNPSQRLRKRFGWSSTCRGEP